MRKFTALIVSLAMVLAFALSGCGGSETTVDETAPEHFILTGAYEDGIINLTEVSDEAEVVIWNEESGEFEEGELSQDTVVGNFTKLSEKDDDGVAGKVEIVPYESKAEFWDEDALWIDGAGIDSDPAVDDATGAEVYSAEYRIPMGERILAGFKLGDYSGTTDFSNLATSTYWTDNDYYHATSDDTLTMLTGYKTYLQTTSWTCGLASIATALEWYGVRDGLNDIDLAALRGDEGAESFARGTEINEMVNVFNALTDLGITGEWEITTSDDDPDLLYDPEWIQNELKAGHPIIAGWNSFGWHYQTIIGYDNMGTEDTLDDVLILMDPYDTTDHDNNGYAVESYERLAYGTWTSPTEVAGTKFITAAPAEGWEYEPTMGEGIAEDYNNAGVFTDDNKLPYGNTAQDLKKHYPDTEALGDNGLAGAATGGYERSGDHNYSPYYKFFDFYNMEDTETRQILNNFQTLQQSTEWTCGTTSATMVMNWFGMLEGETDISLATKRQDGDTGATYLSGMEEVFQYMNDTYDQDWTWFTNQDLDDPQGEESYIGDYCLQAGTLEDWYGLIPYLLENDIPMMIGWDEWGGHWQVIIGYDDMGTPEATQDDVLILADPYDTTDHNQDGYVIESFERLVYGWYSSFEEENTHNDFIVAFPAGEKADVIEALGLEQ
ncbi:MAG: papain-like cysteine protease family protein [Bacillota bacterium]|nr:papain-like cysteine protease family protein [Bacillota bacterium]